MDFSDKKTISIGSNNYFSGTWKKPLNCPRCGYGTDAPLTGCSVIRMDSGYFITVAMKCTHCQKTFISLYEATDPPETAQFIRCYPSYSGDPVPTQLSDMSPRFADLNRQAQTAEEHELIDIAAVGYRAALEVLVKDYAIKELSEPEEEVKQKKLAGAIGKYLKQEELVATADVVRILGNDYAHFERQYPQLDFNTLKYYYQIFLNMIKVQYDIKHPPVTRQG